MRDAHLRRVHTLLDEIERELMRFSCDDLEVFIAALREWEPDEVPTALRKASLLDQFKVHESNH